MTPTEHLESIQAAKDIVNSARASIKKGGDISENLMEVAESNMHEAAYWLSLAISYIELHIASLDKSGEV